MKLKFNTRLLVIFAAILCISGISCKKMFDVLPEDKLDISQAYNNVKDADAAVFGIYGKLTSIAKQYVILNELRADLLDVTDRADPYLRQLNDHNASLDNPYINPRPFYEVILNCNDVMKNFDIMLRENKMSESDYQMRYSDVASVRTWLYLQLGIHFGSVPYITEPLETVNDLKDETKYPRLNFGQILPELIKTMEALPYLKQSPYGYPSGSSLVLTADGNATQKFFINKLFLLGDLYLWSGRYKDAASSYKDLMEAETNNSNINTRFNTFRINFGGDSYDFTVSYNRDRPQDETSLNNSNSSGWRSIFALDNTNAVWNTEWIWALPFNENFDPQNPFIDLFSNAGGSYLVKPSTSAIENWDRQIQFNGIPYDARGKIFTYNLVNGQPVVMKYLYNYDPASPLIKKGKWFLWRAAGLHLHYAEAANRDGMTKVAYALVNGGINSVYATGISNPPANEAELNKMRTNEPYPYNFDARTSGSVSTVTRDPWHKNTGIRGRANLPAYPSTYQTDMLGMEEKIVEESALELAYEGYRWPDLMRIAMRRNDPSFLANKVADKLVKANNPNAEAVRSKLMDINNWYLPFNWH